MSSTLGLFAVPVTDAGTIANKTVAASTSLATLISEFDVWQEDYAGAIVEVFVAGTTTYANLYTDFNLSTIAANPQTLLTREDSNGRTFGKFTQSLYTDQPYYLQIRTQEETGVQRVPLSSLKGENASEAVSTTLNGSRSRALRERFEDVIHAQDYGFLRPTSDVDASASENSATIQAAIGIATADGGGRVYVPAGTYAITTLQLPTDVELIGQGRSATTLQSAEGTVVISITGDDAAIRDLTLDGINLKADAIGVASKDVDRLRFQNVTIKRFDVGMRFKGGCDFRIRDLIVNNCNYGFRGLGDADASNGSDGDAFERLIWDGGEVSETNTTGAELSVVDLQATFNEIRNVQFRDNIGDQALLIYGAENTVIESCVFSGNLIDLDVKDNPDTTLAIRQVRNLYVYGGEFKAILAFDGLCDAVRFEGSQFDGATFQMNVPENQIVFVDTIESGTTTTGDGTKKAVFQQNTEGEIVGVTTGSTAVVVWKHQLEPGEVMFIEATAAAARQNGEEYAVIKMMHGARCDSADLDYDGQTANFTVGADLTGSSSGALATIVADSDSGTTGTLSLINIDGTFVDNEIITDDNGTPGSARVNGTLTYNNAALIGTATTDHSKDSGSSGYAVAFAVSGREVQVTVAGASSETVNWNVLIKTTSIGG